MTVLHNSIRENISSDHVTHPQDRRTFCLNTNLNCIESTWKLLQETQGRVNIGLGGKVVVGGIHSKTLVVRWMQIQLKQVEKHLQENTNN